MNKQKKKKPILKYSLFGCGTLILTGAAIVTWFIVSLFSESDAINVTAYHPFKSEKAKEKYLKHYDKRAQEWPVDSGSRMITTSQGQTYKLFQIKIIVNHYFYPVIVFHETVILFLFFN